MRIRNKLFITFFASGLLLTLVLLMLARWSMDRGMLEYLNSRERDIMMPVAERLSELYAKRGSWDFLRENPRLLGRLIRSSSFSSALDEERPEHDDDREEYESHEEQERDRRREYDFRRDREDHPERPAPHRSKPRVLLLDSDKRIVLGPAQGRALHNPDDFNLLPVESGGEVVGWFASKKRFRLTKAYELAFVEQQYRTLLLISVVVIVIALIISVPLARHFLKPIRQIAINVSNLRQGEFEQLQLKRNDEFGELARDINELSETLAKNKAVRDRWLADTSHELRTPIAILKGEIEAMLDGVRTIDQEGIESLRQEVEKLQKLIDDLNTLSNADIGGLRYQKETLDFGGLVTRLVKRHQASFESAGLSLTMKCSAENIRVFADAGRITQLLDNLLSNSLKYTDAGGRTEVDLNVTQTGGAKYATLTVQDSSPGVPDEALEHLFEHLYRVEASRNRNTGGSGLGLAICQRIVEGHQGYIRASHSSLGGLQIQVELPLSD